MAVNYNSKVVLDNIVIYLDAANSKSTTGSSWNNMLPPNSTGTLTNSPTLSNGYFTFNGTSQYGTIASNLSIVYGSSWTVEVWIYPETSNGSWIICPQTYGIDHGIRSYASSNQVGLLVTEAMDVNNIAYYAPAAANAWHQVVCQYDFASTKIKMWVDGVMRVDQTPATPVAPWGDNWSIGSRGNSTFYYPGRIGLIMGYNGVLTDNQVKQNFNAFRGRYGI